MNPLFPARGRDELERRLRAAAPAFGPRPPSQLHDRIVAALHGVPRSTAPLAVERSARLGSWIAAAAAAVVLCSAWWLTHRTRARDGFTGAMARSEGQGSWRYTGIDPLDVTLPVWCTEMPSDAVTPGDFDTFQDWSSFAYGFEITGDETAAVVALSRGLLDAGTRVLELPGQAEGNLRLEAEKLLADTTRVAEGVVRGLPAPLRARLQ